MALKTLSLGFYRTCSGSKWGFDRAFLVLDRTFFRCFNRTLGEFDRTFLGRSPNSGYCFNTLIILLLCWMADTRIGFSCPAGFDLGLRNTGHLRLLRESFSCFVSCGFRLQCSSISICTVVIPSVAEHSLYLERSLKQAEVSAKCGAQQSPSSTVCSLGGNWGAPNPSFIPKLLLAL